MLKLLLPLLVVLTACAAVPPPVTVPGDCIACAALPVPSSSIEDTAETRAVLDVIFTVWVCTCAPALASAAAIAAVALWPGKAPAIPEPCTDRVFLEGDGVFSWGSVTRWRKGYLTAFHVIAEGTVSTGPPVTSIGSLEATDFAFLTGSDPKADPSSVPFPDGPVMLEGFPARATARERVRGKVYAPDTVPPGIWIILDHPEPLVGGFSGGCVRDAQGRVVAVIMGASTMRLDGKPRHFARVIPIRSALSEIQGTPPTAPAAFLGKPLPPAARWPDTRITR